MGNYNDFCYGFIYLFVALSFCLLFPVLSFCPRLHKSGSKATLQCQLVVLTSFKIHAKNKGVT